MTEKTGIILKGIGGFFYVRSADGVTYECKARGVFRKNDLKPVAGDHVEISIDENGCSVIEKVLPRKNVLTRPPIANLDQIFIVASILEPTTNIFIVDQLTVIASLLEITPIIVCSKSDLGQTDELLNTYTQAGLSVLDVTKKDTRNLKRILDMLSCKTSAFIGNSGVGKSTLLNRLFSELNLSTGQISKKLGRGKHVTRQVELFNTHQGYVADTPGFSSLDLIKCVDITVENLPCGFKEFQSHLGKCKFNSCTHTCEKGCAIIEAVQQKRICRSRYESYLSMYKSLKDVKPWT